MGKGHSHGIDTLIEINALPGLSTEELRSLWIRIFKRPLPPNPRREFLVGSLAYEIQGRAHGFLQTRSVRALCLLAKDMAKGLRQRAEARALRPGTRLVRTWQGDTHEVLALDKGFSYRGETYLSLSEIARLITGARWSGPLFFGLKSPNPKSRKASVKGAA